MALNPRSVDKVVELFKQEFPDNEINYKGLNKYGADEVYIYPRSLQTPEIGRIHEVSRQIGNTVSILIHDGNLCVCYW